eukprot:gene19398-26051_t
MMPKSSVGAKSLHQPSMLRAQKPVMIRRPVLSVRAQADSEVEAITVNATGAQKRALLRSAMAVAAAAIPFGAAKSAVAAEDANAVASSRMSYSRFLEYIAMGRVKKVDLFENGTIAVAEAVSPELGNRIQRVRVQLPGTSPELLQKFREKKIDYAAHSNTEDGGSVFLNLLSNLAFPLLLVGGLFLLSRRAGGGGGGPGGPGNPMAFGKSKAKFQMEPNTGRRGLTSITDKEIDDAVDRIVAGLEGKPLTDGKAKSLVAYHEIGHALCATMTPGHDPVQKVTLIPRGQARGLTWFVPGEDPSLISKSQIAARVVGALGGRAAEEVVFGEAEVTSGASSDLQMVTNMARQMVINYGMSDIGPWSLMDPSAQSGDMIMRMMAKNSMSENLQNKIDQAVKKISIEGYDKAVKLIQENREAIDRTVEVLCEKETITGDEFRAILSEYTTIPAENLEAVQMQKRQPADTVA